MSWLYKPKDIHVCQVPFSDLTYEQRYKGRGLPAQGSMWQCDDCAQIWEVAYSGLTGSSVTSYQVDWRKFTQGDA